MPDGFQSAIRLLPPEERGAAERLSAPERERTEEFRLRFGRPSAALVGEREQPLSDRPVTETELRYVLDAATQSSYHAAADELRRGFLSARGGVRVGICGTAVTEGRIRSFREFSSVAIRVPRQIRGAGAEVISRLGAENTLILSPPGAGKTTFLRELVRSVSDGGTRVGLADERGELAAACRGAPQFDVGRCTDVLSDAPKAEAAMLLLRAMNPQVIALDEISAPEDIEAVLRIAGCGVRIYATAHAASAEALRQRPLYRTLLDERIFSQAVVITKGEKRSYAVTAL